MMANFKYRVNTLHSSMLSSLIPVIVVGLVALVRPVNAFEADISKVGLYGGDGGTLYDTVTLNEESVKLDGLMIEFVTGVAADTSTTPQIFVRFDCGDFPEFSSVVSNHDLTISFERTDKKWLSVVFRRHEKDSTGLPGVVLRKTEFKVLDQMFTGDGSHRVRLYMSAYDSWVETKDLGGSPLVKEYVTPLYFGLQPTGISIAADLSTTMIRNEFTNRSTGYPGASAGADIVLKLFNTAQLKKHVETHYSTVQKNVLSEYSKDSRATLVNMLLYN